MNKKDKIASIVLGIMLLIGFIAYTAAVMPFERMKLKAAKARVITKDLKAAVNIGVYPLGKQKRQNMEEGFQLTILQIKLDQQTKQMKKSLEEAEAKGINIDPKLTEQMRKQIARNEALLRSY